MIKIFSENSFYDPWPGNKSNTQATATPVSLNLFNYTDNADPILYNHQLHLISLANKIPQNYSRFKLERLRENR